jgi:uncharacterized membrane protein AbrB (regulator of aidB expression)
MHISAGPDLWESFDTPLLLDFMGCRCTITRRTALSGMHIVCCCCCVEVSSLHFPWGVRERSKAIVDCSHGRSGRRGRITITKYTPLVLVFLSFRLFICCVISWLGRYSIVSSTCLGCL